MVLVEKYGSKTRPSASSSMPTPVSVTSRRDHVRLRRCASIVSEPGAGHRVQRVLDDVRERAGDRACDRRGPAGSGAGDPVVDLDAPFEARCDTDRPPRRPAPADRPARAARWATRRSSRTPTEICRSSRTCAEDRGDAALEHRPERLAAIGVHAPQVLGGQLNRRQRILDLVRDLPRHLGPGFEPVRPFELVALRLQLGRHAVERVDQAAQLVGRLARRSARRSRRARCARSRASAAGPDRRCARPSTARSPRRAGRRTAPRGGRRDRARRSRARSRAGGGRAAPSASTSGPAARTGAAASM